MEKKRRARINESLQELRLLIADAEVRLQVQYWERLLVVPVVVYALVKRCLLPATSCDVFSNFTSLCHPLQLQSKMENAEVLEMTVKRVESILQTRAQGKTVHNTPHNTS